MATTNDWSARTAIESEPGKVSGAWAFKGARVPVSALFNNLKGGATIDECMEWFPGVTHRQVDAVLTHQIESLESGADHEDTAEPQRTKASQE